MSANGQVALSERPDFQAIAAWIKPDSTVLDLGCGDGVLLKYLRQTRDARGYGIDIDDANVLACVKNGVNVIQSDLERGLAGFDAGSFDCVILSQTLQAVRRGPQSLETMPLTSLEVNAGRVWVRTLPCELSQRVTVVTAAASGPSRMLTMSYLPSVQ